MEILKIIAWAITVFLAISVVYSSNYHFKKYLSTHTVIKKYWRRIIIIQLIKIALIILLLLIVTNGNRRNENKSKVNENAEKELNNWSEEAKQQFLIGCIDSIPVTGFSYDETVEYCECVLEKTIEEYPNPEIVKGDLPEAFVLKAGTACFNEINK